MGALAVSLLAVLRGGLVAAVGLLSADLRFERAGLGQLNEGQKLSYELERGQQGKTSAVNLREV